MWHLRGLAAASALAVCLCAGSPSQSSARVAEVEPLTEEEASLLSRFHAGDSDQEKVKLLSALRAHKNERIVDALSEIVLDEREGWRVRGYAVRLLKSTRSPRAIPALLTLFTQLRDNPALNLESGSLATGSLHAVGEAGGEAAVPVLFDLWNDEANKGWQSFIITALGYTGSESALGFLLARAHDEVAVIRSQVAFALGRIDTQDEAKLGQIREALMRLAQDQDYEVRHSAVNSLTNFSDAQVIGLLERIAAEDPYRGLICQAGVERVAYLVREDAARSLDIIRDEIALKAREEEERAGTQRLVARLIANMDAELARLEDGLQQGQGFTVKDSAVFGYWRLARVLCREDTLTSEQEAALHKIAGLFEQLKDSQDEQTRMVSQEALELVRQRLGTEMKRSPRQKTTQ